MHVVMITIKMRYFQRKAKCSQKNSFSYGKVQTFLLRFSLPEREIVIHATTEQNVKGSDSIENNHQTVRSRSYRRQASHGIT